MRSEHQKTGLGKAVIQAFLIVIVIPCLLALTAVALGLAQ